MDFTALFRVCCYVLLSLLQITTLYHVDGSTFSQRRSSKRELLNCSLKCPNGYDTDIEGNPFCRCYDPCSNMFCLGSMTCVVNPRKRCKKCPRAVCKDLTRATGNSILDNNIQSDSAVNRDVTTPATADVCSLGVQESAFKCKRKRRRWYFDEKTGTCVKFKGCKGNGNNFSRKKLCKRQCIKKKKRRSRKGRKNRRRTMTNRTTGGRKHLESRAPDVVEFRVHVDQPPKLHAAFSAPGVYYTAMCPPDKPMVHCESNPCDNCRHFYVICEVNLCGKCSANYFHRRTGRQLTKCSV